MYKGRGQNTQYTNNDMIGGLSNIHPDNFEATKQVNIK